MSKPTRPDHLLPTDANDLPRSLLSDEDLFLFNEGTHTRLYDKLGAHASTCDGVAGAHFAVWAPNAKSVSVIGEFNAWDPYRHPLRSCGESGIWEGFVPGVAAGCIYKYHIASRHGDYRVDKADPFALCSEVPPRTASLVWNLDYAWSDQGWMRTRREPNALKSPLSIYEVHLGSWRRDAQGQWLGYRALALELADHVERMGFTHVELLPVMEHPFYGSWGYQVTGYFAPTSRYGTPQDLMFLIDTLHQRGIGVILDWVPSHFPSDEHALGFFDGTHLFEHADPRQGFHPDWHSLIFNYGRKEIQSFLLSSALFWLDQYHADGLRVDGVASMLYLDYSRKPGEWIPNAHGGRENLEAIQFLRRLNEVVYQNYPDVQTFAEESTAWPMVSRPTYLGGLGFGMKWDMGWMHDALEYARKDPIHRKHHHTLLTFRMLYAFHENFVLSLSHDEVVHGKGSLISKMPGDDWQKFANLRLLLGYQFAQPGKKLLFMGAELAEWREWQHEESLDWRLLDFPAHAGMRRWVEDLNRLYRREPALQLDFEPAGFEWIDCNDAGGSTLSFLRKGSFNEEMLVACNFTPVPRRDYRLGAARDGRWQEVLSSDAQLYGGSGHFHHERIETQAVPWHGRPCSVLVNLPPLAVVFFKREV